MRVRLDWMLALLLPFGCEESRLEGMQGRWTGSIICYGATSDLTVSFTVEGNSLTGSAQARYKDNNTAWTVRGGGATSCAEDGCRSDRDCPLGFLAQDARAGELRRCVLNPVCLETCKSDECDPCAACKPCQVCDGCSENWLPVNLTFYDADPRIPDPELKLWRYGDTLLRGSIFGFCPDEKVQHPEVELRRE